MNHQAVRIWALCKEVAKKLSYKPKNLVVAICAKLEIYLSRIYFSMFIHSIWWQPAKLHAKHFCKVTLRDDFGSNKSNFLILKLYQFPETLFIDIGITRPVLCRHWKSLGLENGERLQRFKTQSWIIIWSILKAPSTICIDDTNDNL